MVDIQIDAKLDPAIQFPQTVSLNQQGDSRAIFLTGVTGFLGAYLLSDLLQTTEAAVYCLVRCDGPQPVAMQRIQDHLAFYELWQPEFASRIIPVIGDLGQPKLGLSEARWQELAQQINIIYHNGAQVNAVYPYPRLKAANVDGTQEVLRLAGHGEIKQFHFVSSLGIFLSQTYNGQPALETDFPLWDGRLKGGYKQSKWVAEALVWEAMERGLPASIYRPGIIMEHSQTGIRGKPNNITLGIEACIQLGKFPILETSCIFAPVDYVSQAIVHLSQQQASIGKAFHLSNPSATLWRTLFMMLSELGHPLEETEFAPWFQELDYQAAQHPEDKALSLLRFLMRLPMNLFSIGPQTEVKQTIDGLKNSSVVCPPIDKKLLATYFSRS